MSLLPASASARRAEEAVRERARTEAIDRIGAMERKLDGVIMGGAQASPTPPTPKAPDPIRDLALAIGQDRVPLPLSVIISRRFTVDGEEIATAIQVGHLTFELGEAVRLGLLSLDGRYNHFRAGELLHANPPPGWSHPLHEATRPAARSRL
jgi:hypothetical protein